MSSVCLLTPDDLGEDLERTKVVQYLEGIIQKVKEGDTIGVLVLMEGKKDFSFGRVNMKIETGLALLSRVSYRLNQEWNLS